MDGFSAGLAVAETCHGLQQQIDELRQALAAYQVEHEANPGAHAPAFAAHGLSPGAVAEAEETAEAILDTALETLEEATETALATIEGAGEGVAETADTAVEGAAEPVAEVAEPVKAVAEESKPERAPHRPHFLHRPIRMGGR